MSADRKEQPPGKSGRVKYFWPALVISMAAVYTAAYLSNGGPPETPSLAGMAVAAGILALIVAGVLQAIFEKKAEK
ncbi:MAG TPA: hypothetical protein VMU06_08820 [Stellaceae bacterium]|nr:hypothetical protein [Stellaceae bacterium]